MVLCHSYNRPPTRRGVLAHARQMGGGAEMNQVTIPAAELIQLANRIKSLEDTLVRIATFADAIRILAVEATTEQSSVDHLREVTKMMEVQK